MKIKVLIAMLIFLLPAMVIGSEEGHVEDAHEFPISLSDYNDSHLESIPEILLHRIQQDPFNLVALIIFLLAIMTRT